MVGRFASLIALTLLTAAGAGCSITSSPEELEKDAAESDLQSRSLKCHVPPDPTALADELYELINAERERAGLPAVQRCEKLDAIAADYACRMITRGFFDHTDPETEEGPGQRAIASGYRFYQMGENLALGQQTAEEAMAWLMASSAHRTVILGPAWVEVGIGVRVGGAYNFYWVQEFGDPVIPQGELADAHSR